MLLNSYNDCFSLISLYYKQILADSDQNSLVVKFEDIISSPETEIQKIIRYCDLDLDKKGLEEVIDKIDKSKCYAYKNNSELLDFEHPFEELIKTMGYSI